MSLKENDKWNEDIQYALDQTIYILQEEARALNNLLDKMVITTQERNKVISNLITDLEKLIK